MVTRFRTALAMLLVLAFLLTACGDVTATPAAQPATGNQAAATTGPAQLADKQELVVGAGADNFDTTPLKANQGNYPFSTSMCESLVRLDEKFAPQPLLATKWELIGSNTYRFTLRDGVTFWDGSKMTAEDVKWSLDRTVKGKSGYSFLGDNSIKIVDPMTVEVTPTQPNLRLIDQILHPTYVIIKNGTDLATQPMCTGPFKYLEYVKNERFVVERNPNYWGEKAKLQKMTYRFFPDANTRRLALESGEIDFMMDLPPEQVGNTKARSGLKVVNAPVGRTMLMYLNIHGKAPFVLLQDKAIRQAIGYSIDRNSFVNKVWEGNAAIVATMGPPEVLGEFAKNVQGFTYDPTKAASLLDQSGWKMGADKVRAKDGQRLSISLVGWAEWDNQILDFLQAQLGAVGIEMKIIKSPDQASYNKVVNAGEFDIDLEGPNQNDSNPIFLPALRFYSKATSVNMPFFAPKGQFDTVVEQGSAAVDRATTQQKAAESMQILIDQEAIVIPVAGLYRIYAMKNNIQGFVPHPSQTNQWWNTIYIGK